MNARLSYRDTVIPKCTIVNANSEGVLVSTVDLEIPKMVLVKLVIYNRRTVELHPLVVHSSIGQAGLWFYKDQESWKSLWETLINSEDLGRQFDPIEDHQLPINALGVI